MSRHRNVRALDVDEEYDGFYSCYGHSVEEDFCISPSTEAQFLYNRSRDRSHLSSFVESPESVLEEEGSEEEESLHSTDSNSEIMSRLNDLDKAKFQSCVEAMQDVVGETIAESVLQKAAYESKFNLELALNSVLQDKAPKPRRGEKAKAASTPEVSYTPEAVSVCKPSSQSAKQMCETPKESRLKIQTKDSAKSPSVSRKDKKLQSSSKSGDSPFQGRSASSKDGSDSKSNTPAGSDTVNKPDVSAEESKISTPSAKSSKAEKSGREIYDMERKDEKPLINLVVIGHVDAGKSTLMGHLLYRLGNISQKNIHKFERDSKKIGKGSFMYAWVLDETPEERNRGITMDVAFSSFETEHRSVVLLDAPGHKDFIPNMITGAAQADVAVLVVDATKGEFETGFEAGGQTREHTMLIRSLGVSELAVAVNKMDNVGWSEERFADIQSKMSSFLRQVGFREADVTFVPCSGLTGENLASRPQEAALEAWYKGPMLVEVIDRFVPPPRPVDCPLRMCVGDAFKGPTGGFCASGKIDAGFVKSGDRVLLMPSGDQAVVKGITIDDKPTQYSFAGDQAVLQLSGADPSTLAPGSVVCDPDNPIRACSRFRARLVVFNTSVPITKGFPVVLHYQSLSEQAVVRRLVATLNRSSGEVVKSKPRCLSKNSSALVEIEVNRPICLELYKDFKDLGRFMLRSGGATIAAGLVTEMK